MKHLSLIFKKNIFRARQKGAAAVEFAIVISLLVLITGGIIEFGRVLWYYDALTKATRDGARFMSTANVTTIVSATTGGVATATTLVVNAANAAGVRPNLTGGNVDIQCTYLVSEVEGDWGSCHNNVPVPVHVRVKISGYNVTFGSWFPIPLPSDPLALTPYTTMRYMCAADATTSC